MYMFWRPWSEEGHLSHQICMLKRLGRCLDCKRQLESALGGSFRKASQIRLVLRWCTDPSTVLKNDRSTVNIGSRIRSNGRLTTLMHRPPCMCLWSLACLTKIFDDDYKRWQLLWYFQNMKVKLKSCGNGVVY